MSFSATERKAVSEPIAQLEVANVDDIPRFGRVLSLMFGPKYLHSFTSEVVTLLRRKAGNAPKASPILAPKKTASTEIRKSYFSKRKISTTLAHNLVSPTEAWTVRSSVR
jgi:hypothetical protein